MTKKFKPRRASYKLRASVCAFGRLGVLSARRPPLAPGTLGPQAAQAVPHGPMPLAVFGECRLPQGRVPSDDEQAVIVAFGSHAAAVLRKAEAENNLAAWAALARAANRHPDLTGRDLVRLTRSWPLDYVAKMLEALGQVTLLDDAGVRRWLDRYKREPALADSMASVIIRSAIERGLPLDPEAVDEAIASARQHAAPLPETAREAARLSVGQRLASAADDPHHARILDRLHDSTELARVSRRYVTAPTQLRGRARGLLALSRVNVWDSRMLDRVSRLAASWQTHRSALAAAGVGALDLVALLEPVVSEPEFATIEALLLHLPHLGDLPTHSGLGERLIGVARRMLADGQGLPPEEMAARLAWRDTVRTLLAAATDE